MGELNSDDHYIYYCGQESLRRYGVALIELPGGSDSKASCLQCGIRSLGQEDPLEKEMATHSSTLAWKIPWVEERGRLQSIGSQRVGYN